MQFIYPAVFSKREDGGYRGYFPDLEQCYAEGDTLDEVISGIWFAIQLTRGKVSKNEMRPFGPFLAGTTIVYLLVFK